LASCIRRREIAGEIDKDHAGEHAIVSGYGVLLLR